MLSDSLYASAFAVKKAKLWKKLSDTQLFAVRHSDSTISYCWVMGHTGQFYSLAFLLNESDLVSIDRIHRQDDQPLLPHEQLELFCLQDCMSVSFVNKAELRDRDFPEISAYCKANGIQPRGAHAYPRFDRCRPPFIPWYLDDETDQRHMQEGLSAALDVARRLESETPEALGFRSGSPYAHSLPLLTATENGFVWSSIRPKQPSPPAYPAAVIADELAFARLNQARTSSGEWACMILLHNQPIVPSKELLEEGKEPRSAPFYPYTLMIVSMEDGQILELTLTHDPEDYVPSFVTAVLETARQYGKPTALCVQDDRTYDFLRPIAHALGIRLHREEAIEPLCDALDGYFERFYAPDDQMSFDDELDLFIEVLRNGEALRQMPQTLFKQVFALADKDVLPVDVFRAIQKEAQRRKML